MVTQVKSIRQILLPIVLLALTGTITTRTFSQPTEEGQRRIAVFEQLKFAEVPSSPRRLTNAELLDAVDMFDAYASGAAVLPQYRDPIETRGAKGISLFRAVAPAVTLVVVGNDQRIEGLGAGALVRADGYVLTNWHVITGHAAALVFLKPASSAELKDARAFGARVVYQDSMIDLALLKLVEPAPGTLPTIPLADPSTLEVAEDVHIIGHPHGELWSYSTGVISQIRSAYEWTYSDGSRHRARVLQMQTAINPGNSGGPVLSDAGSMVGLVAMSQEGQNLDYAIAADVIRDFLRLAFASRTRGSTTVAEQPYRSYLAKTSTGEQVTKASIGSTIVYWVSTPQLQDAEVFIVGRSGRVVHGQHPNAAGGFSDWSGSGEQGTIHAISNGHEPEVFASKPINPPQG